MSEPRLPYLELDTWKAKAADGEAPTNVQLRKAITFEKAEELPDEPDTVRIVITTDDKDRQNDVIESAGWSLQEFLANPIVTFAHSYSEPPVGRSPRIEQQPHKLIGFPEFTPKDLYPFGHMIGQMVRQGFLNAASVGFSPIQWRFDEELHGVRFYEQSLLEFAIVPIPANAGALVEARSLGIDLTPLKAWAEQALDLCAGAGLWVPRADLEVAYCTLNEGKLISIPTTEVILRSGRVLSAKNETAVRDAVASMEGGITRLKDVLNALPAPPDEDQEDEEDALVGEAFHWEAIKQEGWTVQTLIFPKAKWSKADAQQWCRDHDYKDGVDETGDSYRMRQRDPGAFARLRTICLTPTDTNPGDEACRIKAVGGPLKSLAPEDLPVKDLPAVQDLDGEYVELADEPEEGLMDLTREELAALIREQMRASIMAVTGRLD
jgi:HK97 family phage prohead protease